MIITSNIKAYEETSKRLFEVQRRINEKFIFNDTMRLYEEEEFLYYNLDVIWRGCSWFEKRAIKLFVGKLPK